MRSLRLKFGERPSDLRCCLCCHVRTGTIFLGMYHLLINMLTLSMLAVTYRFPEYFQEDMDAVLPTPLSAVDDDNFPGFKFVAYSVDGHGNSQSLHPQPPLPHSYRTVAPLNQRDWNISVFFTMCTLGLSLLLLYGAIKRKASYLMPFFGFQVFNFCITSMSAVGYLCYPPNLNQLIQDNQYMPFKEELLQINPQTLSLYAVLALILVMMVKAYFIGVVWSCYKYLTIRQVAVQRIIHFLDTDNQNLVHDLPDYDTAVKKFPTPPPSYAAAVLNQAPPPIDADTSAPLGPSTSAEPNPLQNQQPWLTVRAPPSATSTGAVQQV